MNCSHVCALGGIFTYPWLWGSCKAVRISLSVSLPFVLSQAPSSLCHPTVSLSLFYIHEGTGVCTDTSRRIVLDVARTFADWRLVEITRSKPTVFLSLSLSLSLWITASPIYKHRYETNAKMNWTSWATDQPRTDAKKGTQCGARADQERILAA